MNDNRNLIIIRNTVCILLSVLLAAGLLLLYYRDRQREKAQSAALEALVEEVASYEKELSALRAELSGLENSYTYISEEASIMVGFNVTGVEDFSYIREKAQQYGFSPVLVLDCTIDLAALEMMIDTADTDWEIMLYATNFSEDVNGDVLEVLSYLADIGREHTGIFLLRSGYDGASNVQLLIGDGFVGYTSYHDESPQAGQTEEGDVYFDYSYLTADASVLTSRLSALYSRKSAMITVFDMSSVNTGDLTETYITSILTLMQEYDAKDDCSFSTVADVVEELSGINAILAAGQAEYEAEAAALEEQIAEMEETIAGIYDGWKN